MLVHAHATLIADIEKRVDDAVAPMETAHHRIEHILPTVLQELLPFDERRRTEAYCLLAFSGAALDHPGIGDASRRWQARIRELLARAVENGKECGEVHADTDAGFVAWEIAAAVRGMAWAMYEDPSPEAEQQARATLIDLAARWFCGRCSRNE